MIWVIGHRAKLAGHDDACPVAPSRASAHSDPALRPGRGLAALCLTRGPIGGVSKRSFDAVAAAALLIALLPLFLLLAAAIKLHDGGPVFYRHRRVGRNCTAFFCIKFRTMVVDADHRLQRY